MFLNAQAVHFKCYLVLWTKSYRDTKPTRHQGPTQPAEILLLVSTVSSERQSGRHSCVDGGGFLCYMASSSVYMGSLFLFLQCCCSSYSVFHVAHSCRGTSLLSGLLVRCLAGSAVATAAVIWLPRQPCVLIDLSVCTKSLCI